MKKFILILAVVAIALAQESCNRNETEQKEDSEKGDTCVIDTLEETPVLDLDSICND